MAILMVYDRDNSDKDPIKEARGCYKRGYVVEVFEDDKKLVEPPASPFLFIKVPDMSRDEAMAKYMRPEIDLARTSVADRITRRRAIKIDLDLLDKTEAESIAKLRVVSFASETVLKAKAIEIKTGLTLSSKEVAN